MRACLALARVFADADYAVAVDDVLEPETFDRLWRPQLHGLCWRVVVVVPTLEATLARSAARGKRVDARHSRAQHRRCLEWPPEHRVDTTALSVEESLALVQHRLGESACG